MDGARGMWGQVEVNAVELCSITHPSQRREGWATRFVGSGKGGGCLLPTHRDEAAMDGARGVLKVVRGSAVLLGGLGH
jgi:hypothetical protein